LKRFTTFFITHFRPQASTFLLRKGFEVCGILEDVFVANNRNRNGEVYGFVRFANVRDVDKLLKALNNVCFGRYCVCVMLARFDRKGERKGIEMREGEGVGGKAGGSLGGEVVKVRKKEAEGEKRKEGLKGRVGEEKKKEEGRLKGDVGGLRVGMVVVRVGGTNKKGGEGEGVKEVADRVEGKVGRKANMNKLTEHTRLIWKYRSCAEDGTVIQNRVEDTGFKDIDIIPLGADEVFVRSLSSINVSEVVHEAKPFFDMIFSSVTGWTKTVLPFQRGAWIRLYGILLHAWNEDFFKLYVFDCGRYLRADNCSLNRERFDYARVLIATSSL